jgi:hypothetical protein
VQVQNGSARTTAYQVTHTLSTGLTTDEALQHQVTVDPGQRGEFNFGVRLPNATGEFQLTGRLLVDEREIDHDVLVLRVEQNASTLSGGVTARLSALGLTGNDKKRSEEAAVLVQRAAGRTRPEDAIDDVLAAIEKVKQIGGADVSAVRVDLARLLRVYQLRWVP